MKIVILARVSTEEQLGALAAQTTRLLDYVTDKGFEKKDQILFEFDESAYKTSRDKFEEVMDILRSSKEPIAICCDKVDRLIRNFTRELVDLEELRMSGILYMHFPADNIIIHKDSPASDCFRFTIAVSLAKYYSDSIRDNVKRKFEYKLRKGEIIGPAPYGYKNVDLSEDKKWVDIDPFPAKVVSSVYEWYAKGTYSMMELRSKVKDVYGVLLPNSKIDAMLKNPFYYGDMLVKGKLYPHCYETIIEKATFDKVQEIKKSHHKKKFKYAGLPYLYRGMLRCADCGCTITPERTKGHVYYHCTQHLGKHNAAYLREEELTRQFTQVFLDMTVPEQILEKMTSVLNTAHKNKAEMQKTLRSNFEAEYKKYQIRIEKMYEDQLDGRITIDMYDKKYKEYREQQEQIKQKISGLEVADDKYYITVTYLVKLINKAPELFARSEQQQNRQILQLVFQNLVLDGKNIRFNLKAPFDVIARCSDQLLWLRVVMDVRKKIVFELIN